MPAFETIIPTLSYSSRLDAAISSVLKHGPSRATVLVSVNGPTPVPFQESLFWRNPRVRWVCREDEKAPLHESLNFAVKNSNADWIFLLSDDDEVLPGFMEDFVLQKRDWRSLYSTRILNVSFEGKLLGQSRAPLERELSGNEIRRAFFRNDFRDNLSLFVLSRQLFDAAGGYQDSGYPNGYFVDTVLHAKVLSRATQVITAKGPVVLRTSSPSQGSAHFYLGPEVSDFLKITAKSMWEDQTLSEWLSPEISSEEALFERLIGERFFTEWSKLGNRIYGKNRAKRFHLIFSALLYWRVFDAIWARLVSLFVRAAKRKYRRVIRLIVKSTSMVRDGSNTPNPDYHK